MVENPGGGLCLSFHLHDPPPPPGVLAQLLCCRGFPHNFIPYTLYVVNHPHLHQLASLSVSSSTIRRQQDKRRVRSSCRISAFRPGINLLTPPDPAWFRSASLSGFGLFDDDKVDANPFNDDDGDTNDDDPSPTPTPDDNDDDDVDDDNGLDLFDDDEEKSVDNGQWVRSAVALQRHSRWKRSLSHS